MPARSNDARSNELRPSGAIEVRASASLEDAVAAGWESLVDDFELYASLPWLRVEQRLSAEQRLYLVGVADGVPFAGLTAHVFDHGTPPWPFARIDAVLRRVVHDAGAATDQHVFEHLLPTVLLGGRRPGHTRLLVAPHLDEPGRRAVARTMLDAAERLAAERGLASLSWLYVDEHDQLLRDALADAGYLEFGSAIASNLAVHGSFDGYMKSLVSHKRSNILRDQRQLAAAGIRYDVRPLTPELIEAILPLETSLYEKHGTLFPPDEARRLHAAVAAELGDDAQALVGLGDDAIRGFVMLLRRGDMLYARQVGFDYEFQSNQRNVPLYFGVLFYAAVEYAARIGASRIEYGISSEKAKASRGCMTRRQYGYVKLLDAHAHAALANELRLPPGATQTQAVPATEVSTNTAGNHGHA